MPPINPESSCSSGFDNAEDVDIDYVPNLGFPRVKEPPGTVDEGEGEARSDESSGRIRKSQEK